MPATTRIKITKIVTVRIPHHTDATFLHTTLPSGIWPFEGVNTLAMSLAQGTAEEYCKANFPGVPHEIVGDLPPMRKIS